MFPPAQLREIVRLTNINLAKLPRHNLTRWVTEGEIVKFFGIVILMTRYEFKDRASLWSTVDTSKYIPAACFGKTSMGRCRFDNILRCIQFSVQDKVRPANMSHSSHRWQLVDDFVWRFNEYREKNYYPSHYICVDESMIRWYGIGGFYINMGLPQYVDMERKPEKGGEVQNAACGESGILIRLHVVKNRTEEDLEQEAVVVDDDGNEQEALHGAKVLLNLVFPWKDTNRIVCADSYFASVPGARLLHKNGLRFIGVVKTATREYPMQYLTDKVLGQRGDWRAVKVCKENDDDTDLVAFVWMDRDRRYFISSCLNMRDGKPCERIRWRQTEEVESNAEPERMEVRVPQPLICEHYYNACATIDKHNRCRQDDLNIEKKLETNDWAKRFNFSIVGMIVVDSWLAYKQLKEVENESQKEFYEKLAEEMIDNTLDEVATRGGAQRARERAAVSGNDIIDERGNVKCGFDIHLTPTREKRKRRDGSETAYTFQGHCCVCKKKTIHVCSGCQDRGIYKYVCHPKTKRRCFHEHITVAHEDKI